MFRLPCLAGNNTCNMQVRQMDSSPWFFGEIYGLSLDVSPGAVDSACDGAGASPLDLRPALFLRSHAPAPHDPGCDQRKHQRDQHA